MEIPRRICAIAAIVLVLLMFLSASFGFSYSASSTVGDSSTIMNVSAATGYSNLHQYEWPQIHGDSAFTRFSTGPAPEAPDILWKTTIQGVQSYVAAFNGKIFVTTATNVIAINKDTGSIIWNTTLPANQRWPTVYKIDETHLVIGKNCLDPETGKVLWVSDKFSANTAYYAVSVYSSEERLFYTKGKSTVQAWNFSDPSKPPTLAWETYVPGAATAGSGIQYGDGKVFPGSNDAHQMALDAKTGEVIWDTETTGAMMFSGSYYQGLFLRGGMDNHFYCFNATTGKVLWVFNPGTQFGNWCSGSATAYGKVYELNRDGNLYALDVKTGQVVWKYKGPGLMFWPGWPLVADGKVYATTGQRASSDPFTGEYSKSEFACFDAYSGSLLWKLPVEAYAPRESVAIAYGNLYLIPGYIEEDTMDSYTTLNEVWAIGREQWPMFRGNPAHTGMGQSGPANLTLRWKFTSGGAVISSPSIVDGRVYVGSNDKNLYCLNALDGSLLWNFTTDFRIKSSPAVVDGKVYIGPDDGYVYCLDAKNGSLLWKTDAGGYIQAHFDSVVTLGSSPTVVGGRVYVGSLSNKTYCLDANSGNVIWTYDAGGYVVSTPAVVDGAVYFTSRTPLPNATLYKLDSNNANLIWKLTVPYQLIAERGIDMIASPTVADGMVFASSNKFDRYGINATTGKIEWTYSNIAEEYIVDSMSYHDGKLFFIDQFFLVCVQAKNGSTIWKAWLGEDMESSPTYADGKVYIAGSDTRVIYVLNATTGKRLSWFRTGSKCWSSPSLYEGRMYIGNHDWNVYCLVDASFPIISTSIVANLSNDTINRTKSESVIVTGQIKPAIANASIILTFVKPSGTSVNLTVTANEGGNFTASYTPNVVGNWTVKVNYGGAQYPSRIYTSSSSQDQQLKVVEAQPPALPARGTDVPIEYIFASVSIIIIAIVVVAYLFTKRGEKIVEPPSVLNSK